MSSPEKIAANRANALKSTGPKTERGKAHSSLNAVSHGIYARARLLPFECESEYHELAESIFVDVNPVGPIEEALAEEIVTDMWQLRRLELGEVAQLKKKVLSQAYDRITGRALDGSEELRISRALNFEPRHKIEATEEDLDCVLAQTAGDPQQVKISIMVDRRRQTIARRIDQTFAYLQKLQRQRIVAVQNDLEVTRPDA